MLSDATVQRVDLQGYSESIRWSDDGSLAVNTTGSLTILKPRYQSGALKSANELFEIEKIEIESWPRNGLYKNQPADEVVSTNFSSTDDFVSKLLWSPLTQNSQSFLAILTASRSVNILENGKVKTMIGEYATFKTQKEMDDAVTYSFVWYKKDQDLYFITGQASGNLKFYKFDDDEFKFLQGISLPSSSPIVKLKVDSDVLVAVSADNEIIQVNDLLSEKDQEIKILKSKDRFSVYDIFLTQEFVVFTSPTKFQKIDLKTGSIYEVITNIFDSSIIIPNGSSFILISNTTTVKVDQNLKVQPDDKVHPVKTKRLKRWNSRIDSFRLKSNTIKIYGADYNFSGDVLAILYEIEDQSGFKYKISSENKYNIAFLSLDNKFDNVGSSLAIYQEFMLTGKIPTTTIENLSKPTPKGQDFKDYLKLNVLKDAEILKLIANNIISRDKDADIRSRYSQLLLEFVKQNEVPLENPLDRVTYNYIVTAVNGKSNEESQEFKVVTDIFEETFKTDKNNNPDALVSKSGHKWNRCALTFLPIVSTNVKVDPVTQKRIIDISKDELNEYGYFTRTILETLNEVSIYSGCRFGSKP